MSWDFETDPEFQAELDWVESFVREEIEPLDLVLKHPCDLSDPVRQALIPPLQDTVRQRGLWAAHLGPHLGGQGYGQVRLALLNEILGRTVCGPVVFGCQAPDSGNAEILAHYGSNLLKRLYLEPLLRNDIVSAYSMTEPQGGSDPTEFTVSAVLDGDSWVINGEKWFTGHGNFASFLVLLAVTDPDAPPHGRMSMFVVPADTSGVEILRTVPIYGHEGLGCHPYMRYTNVRIPADHILGKRGAGFAIAQTRLGGGRVHHAMRTVGLVRAAFDMMCERALSRQTKGEALARKQLVQAMIADSWSQIEQFRLLVLRTAWRIDKYNDYDRVRADIAAVKSSMPAVLHDVASRALQIHGSLGVTTEMPFGSMIMDSYVMGLADGATEIHKVNLARTILKGHRPTESLFPSTHLPELRDRARRKFSDVLDAHPGYLPDDEFFPAQARKEFQ